MRNTTLNSMSAYGNSITITIFYCKQCEITWNSQKWLSRLAAIESFRDIQSYRCNFIQSIQWFVNNDTALSRAPTPWNEYIMHERNRVACGPIVRRQNRGAKIAREQLLSSKSQLECVFRLVLLFLLPHSIIKNFPFFKDLLHKYYRILNAKYC